MTVQAARKSNSSSDGKARNKGTGHGEKLTRKAHAAVAALMLYPTTAEAAQSAGISQATLWRWLQNEDFRRRLRAAQETVFETALTNLQSSIGDAVNCLRRNLNSKSPSVQVQAARSLIEHALKTRQVFDYEPRIAGLEARFQAREEAEKNLSSLDESQS